MQPVWQVGHWICGWGVCMSMELFLQLFLSLKMQIGGRGDERLALFSFLHSEHFFWGDQTHLLCGPPFLVPRGLPRLPWLPVNVVCVQRVKLPSAHRSLHLTRVSSPGLPPVIKRKIDSSLGVNTSLNVAWKL